MSKIVKTLIIILTLTTFVVPAFAQRDARPQPTPNTNPYSNDLLLVLPGYHCDPYAPPAIVSVGGYATTYHDSVPVSPLHATSDWMQFDVIADLLHGTLVKIIGGPICKDFRRVWKVQVVANPGQIGWMVDGRLDIHYLLPFTI